jgi:hypothetical protein
MNAPSRATVEGSGWLQWMRDDTASTKMTMPAMMREE